MDPLRVDLPLNRTHSGISNGGGGRRRSLRPEFTMRPAKRRDLGSVVAEEHQVFTVLPTRNSSNLHAMTTTWQRSAPGDIRSNRRIRDPDYCRSPPEMKAAALLQRLVRGGVGRSRPGRKGPLAGTLRPPLSTRPNTSRSRNPTGQP